MKTTATFVIGVLAFVLGVGFTVAQDDDEPTEVKEVDISDLPPVAEEACFNVRSIRDFDGITDRFVYVQGRRDEHYLLTMWMQCFGLRNALGIAISNDFSRVCSNSAAAITYRGLNQRETCRIRRVESVESKAAAEEIVELRTRRD